MTLQPWERSALDLETLVPLLQALVDGIAQLDTTMQETNAALSLINVRLDDLDGLFDGMSGLASDVSTLLDRLPASLINGKLRVAIL